MDWRRGRERRAERLILVFLGGVEVEGGGGEFGADGGEEGGGGEEFKEAPGCYGDGVGVCAGSGDVSRWKSWQNVSSDCDLGRQFPE